VEILHYKIKIHCTEYHGRAIRKFVTKCNRHILRLDMRPINGGGIQPLTKLGTVYYSGQSTGCRKDTRFYVNSRNDKIFERSWHPAEGPPKGLVFVCHGYGEHTEWYEEFGEMLASQGFLAFGHDHVGHGLSSGDRATIGDLELYVDDIVCHTLRYKALYRSLPCFIFGHSMGGLLALRAVQRNPKMFRGMVLEGPLIKSVAEFTPASVMALKLTNLLYPDYEAVEFPLEQVSSDTTMLSKLKNDPLRWNHGIKVSMLCAFSSALQLVNKHLSSVGTPFLVLHAEHDKSCHVDGSRKLYEVASVEDKQIITFPEGEHNLFIESPDIRMQAMNETVQWVNSRTVTQF